MYNIYSILHVRRDLNALDAAPGSGEGPRHELLYERSEISAPEY